MRVDRGELVVLLILAGLVAAFTLALWLPSQRDVTGRRRLIAQRETTLAQLRAAGRSDAATDPALAADAPSLELALPPKPDLGPLLEVLSEDLAAKSLVVRRLQARAVIEGAEFDRIPMSLRFTGHYRACVEFLRRVEGYPRIIRVDRIDIAGTSTEAEQPLLIDIEFSTFARADKEGSS